MADKPPWDDPKLQRQLVRDILTEVKATDPNLGDEAVERLGFEIVGYLQVQEDETRSRILRRLMNLSDKVGSTSEADYDEPMLRAHGIAEAAEAIQQMSSEDLGLPLGIFRKR